MRKQIRTKKGETNQNNTTNKASNNKTSIKNKYEKQT